MKIGKKLDSDINKALGVANRWGRGNSLKRWLFIAILALVIVISIAIWMKMGNSKQMQLLAEKAFYQ